MHHFETQYPTTETSDRETDRPNTELQLILSAAVPLANFLFCLFFVFVFRVSKALRETSTCLSSATTAPALRGHLEQESSASEEEWRMELSPVTPNVTPNVT